jgi:hypothetical protein
MVGFCFKGLSQSVSQCAAPCARMNIGQKGGYELYVSVTHTFQCKILALCARMFLLVHHTQRHNVQHYVLEWTLASMGGMSCM